MPGSLLQSVITYALSCWKITLFLLTEIGFFLIKFCWTWSERNRRRLRHEYPPKSTKAPSYSLKSVLRPVRLALPTWTNCDHEHDCLSRPISHRRSLFDQETGCFAVFQSVFDTQKHGLLCQFHSFDAEPICSACLCSQAGAYVSERFLFYKTGTQQCPPVSSRICH